MSELNIIIASGNAHKVEEVKSILSPLGFRVTSMQEEGIGIDVEEKGQTFEENALIKAHALSKYTDKIVLADDSGLMVDALEGAPGVYSARYAGEHGNDRKNNEKLLTELEGIPLKDRSARFYCAIAVVYPEGGEIVVTGKCEGVIAYTPQGENGFGYDPLFYVPEFNKTFGQLEDEEKNKISHRAIALKNLKKILEKRKEREGAS
ncbi:XTP/dITP diphosphatase [Irregularibacter muris]|uniref:dITP/XTP pyrophosphatase n=1 Tax=Irregularibacter muris TaxID=1796619 RepID=A0AAE3HER6_9FIRM|nr:XTP/dITP diphosphatase [Irregularibacter muris]MCR1898766.1 XTP/dITP diphosphatase [Irregularibacter muris]